MKTLIFHGSPRPAGDTASLLSRLTEGLAGEYRIVNAYRCHISPCVDCRRCQRISGCAIDDEMQEIYRYLEDCDNVLIASPIYFSELTGRLLDVGSRLQTYFCARFFRHETPVLSPKRGAVILAGGGSGSVEKPFETARILLKEMNCTSIHDLVFTHRTDQLPAIKDSVALAGIDSIARFFNQSR